MHILFSHLQMQNLGITQSDILCWTYLTSLAYQRKSRERSACPTKHVTFALSQRKSAYPARAQDLDDDEDDKPFVRPDRTTVSEEEGGDINLWCNLASKEKAPKRESSAIRRAATSYTITKKERTSSLARSVCQIGTRCVTNLA